MVKILILDGNPADVQLIKTELKHFTKPYQVTVVNAQAKFEAELAAFKPDIILAEYSLPLYNGIQAFRYCQENNYEGAFILLSSSLSEETLISFVREGMDDYLKKPNLKRLPEAVKNVLERIELHHLKDKANQKIINQNKLVADLFESIFEAAMITKEGKIVDFNHTFTEVFGFSKEEMVGRSVFDFCLPEYFETAKYHVLNNTRDSYQLKFHAKNGNLVTVEVLGRPLIINGEVCRLTSFRDITKIDALEEQLSSKDLKIELQQKIMLNLVRDRHTNVENSIREILTAYGKLLTVERVSLWMYNSERTWIKCRLLYKNSKREFENGLTMLGKDHPIYFKFIEEHRYIAANDAQNDERTSEFTLDYLVPNNISSLLDIPVWVHGQHLGIVCIEHLGEKRVWTSEEIALATNLADIMSGALCAEEQERTLKRMLKSELRFSESEKVANVGDWEYDIKSQTIHCSPETYKIHGREPKNESITVEEYGKLIHPEDRAYFNSILNKVLDSERTQRIEYRIQLPDGKFKYVHANVRLIKLGSETKISGTLFDFKDKLVAV